MARKITFFETLKHHKRWANGLSVVSIALVIGLLRLAAYLADVAKADEASRIGMFIAMTGIVIVVCIWQAAGFIVASIEFLLQPRRDDKGPWE